MELPPDVTVHRDVELRDPVLIAAFRGWNDAGDAASFAATHLRRKWKAKRIASIDPEDFYDFQAVRPRVELVDGVTRRIVWPANDLWAARLEDGESDALMLIGVEPSLRWRAFSAVVVDAARAYGAGMVVTLGALLADVPHSRRTPITGTAVDADLIERLGLKRSRYEGPTGIVGVLHDAFATAGIPSASLWAAVPHYVAVTPNPKAALALVEATTRLIGTAPAAGDLPEAAEAFDRRVAEIVAEDDDVGAYVRMLEERADEIALEEQIDSSQLPTGEALAAELERYLRGNGDD